MADLALSPDRQNAEELMRPPALATPGYQLEQLIEDTEQHTTLPVQVTDADEPSSLLEASEQDPDADEPPSLVEASEQASDDSNTTGVSSSEELDLTELSLEDTIRKYVPDDSDLALSFKERKTCASLVDDGVRWTIVERSNLKEINSYLAAARPLWDDSSLLVIQDANTLWCNALCAKYPESLSPELLAGHIIRFDEIPLTNGKPDAIEGYLKKHYPNAGFQVSSSGNFLSIGVEDTFRQDLQDESWFNIDFIAGSYHGQAHKDLNDVRSHSSYGNNPSNRQDVYERDEQNNWRRISVRLSCFRLAPGFHLILIDSTPTPEGLQRETKWPFEEYTPRMMQIQNPFAVELRLLSGPADRDLSLYRTDAALGHVISLFQSAFEGHAHTLQSALDPQILPATVDEERGWRRAQIFFWLLTETSWRRLVAHQESKLQGLQQEATMIAGDQAFTRLTDLRRQLLGAHNMLAETQHWAEFELMSEFLSWDVGGKTVSADEFWSEERAQPKAVGVIKARSIDIRDLPKMLKKLLGRIETMTRTVNEEIQMVIGSVQVEDARVMRRQTEWTVVLAVLAAIYLPLTLVTGLFGMNIKEIDAGATAPDRWSVVKAWGVVFGATIGSVLAYAVVKCILRYRRVGRMLLGKKMRKIGDGSLLRGLVAFKMRVHKSWLYRNIRDFRKKMRDWDEEAQNMDKME